MKVDKKLLEELYALNKERLKYLGIGLENVFEDKKTSDEAYDAVERKEEEMDEKLREIRINFHEYAALMARALLKAVGHLSFSRFVKCLEVCGVEVSE